MYELKLAKPGAGVGRNLKISSEGKCSSDPSAPGTVPCGGFVRRQGYLTGRNALLSALCSPLSLILDRPVLDKTGLSNAFDITLEWAPDSIGESSVKADVQPGAKSDLPSLFTALEEQLGLKLEGAKAATDVLVVDHAEKPSDN